MDKEREEPCIVIDATGHKNTFAWICWILNNFQQQNREKKNKTSSSLSSLQLFITMLFFHTGWSQGGFILLCDLGLQPTVCSFPKCLGRIFLLLLFLNGSLPMPWGPLLPCDNSAGCTVSAWQNQIYWWRWGMPIFFPYQVIDHFLCLWTLT